MAHLPFCFSIFIFQWVGLLFHSSRITFSESKEKAEEKKRICKKNEEQIQKVSWKTTEKLIFSKLE